MPGTCSTTLGAPQGSRWTTGDSNPAPLQCHCSALPDELVARAGRRPSAPVALGVRPLQGEVYHTLRCTPLDDPRGLYRGIRRHAGFVVSTALILTGLWVLSGAHFFWPAIPLAFLVMGLMRHARRRHYEARYSYAQRVAPWNGPGYR